MSLLQEGFPSPLPHLKLIPSVGLSPCTLVVKNLPANAGDGRDAGLILVLERSPGGGHGNPLSVFLPREKPMDRGAWQATVHRVAKSRTRLKPLSMHAHTLS